MSAILAWYRRNYVVVGFVFFGICLIPLFFVDNLRDWGTFWAFVTALVASIFVVAYGFLADWRKNPDGTANRTGQHIMTLSILIATVMWLVVFSRFGLIPMSWGPYLVYVIYLSFAFSMIWRLVIFINVQMKARKRRRQGSEAR